MTKRVSKFLGDRRGATAIEYGLIAALIAVAVMGGIGTLGSQTGAGFQKTNDDIEAAKPS